MQSHQLQSRNSYTAKEKKSISQRRSKTVLQDNRHSVSQLRSMNTTVQPKEISAVKSVPESNPIQKEAFKNSSPATNVSGETIQCIPLWKKLATGAVAVGGAAAMIAGAPILGGIAMGGSALYGGYKAYHEHQRNKTFRNVDTELDQYAPGINPNVTLNPPAVGRSQTIFHHPMGGPGPAGPLVGRTYGIDINPLDPTGEGVTDPDMVASALTHEKTHIANDQSYDSNLARHSTTAPTNMTNAELGGGMGPGSRVHTVMANVTALRATVLNDRQVPVQWRGYIRNRLAYINTAMNPLLEYDTVTNELLHFMKAKGIEADSKSAQAITRMAKDNHARR